MIHPPRISYIRAALAGIYNRPARWIDLAVLPTILALSIPPLVWFGHHWMIFIDSAEYLLLGGNLASGEGYAHTGSGAPHTKRGPIFPGLIGTLILVLGRDVESLAWGVRLLALANALLAYLLIKRIAGPASGLLAAALVTLFSYTATITEAFNIDTALLTLYLLALLTLLAAAQKDDRFLLSLLSGVLLGTSILTKETSFTTLPLALCAALLLAWNLRGVSFHYAGVLLVCLPWWVWVWSVSSEIYLVGKLPADLHIPAMLALVATFALAVGLYISRHLARLSISAGRRRVAGWALVVAWVTVMSVLLLTTSVALADSSLEIVRRFIVERLAAYTPLWPLLVVAGGHVVWKALRGYRLWQFYAAALALQLPVALLTTVEGWSLRQFLIPQVLLLCALSALVVEVCETAVSGRKPHQWFAVVGAAPLVIYLSVSTVGHVVTLLGEPEDWRSLDRTSRVSETDAAAVSIMHEMHEWIAENVPNDENILLSAFHANYLMFLDSDRHGWSNLILDCDSGRRNPTTTGCVPSEAVAESPPSPTVWFHMEKRCSAIALSMPNLMKQLEQSGSTYLLLSSNPKYPAIVASTKYLLDSGAFEVAHVERRALQGADRVIMTAYLLKRTSEAPEPRSTRMDVKTANHLMRCEARGDNEYAQSIRAKFPNGITLEPISKGTRNPRVEARITAKARELVREVYADR